MLNRISDTLIRIMLGIFMALLSLGVLLGTFGRLDSLSYVFALFLAAGLFLLGLWLRPRFSCRLSSPRRPGVFLTGLMLALFCFLLNLIWVLNFQIQPTVDFYTFY